MGCPCLAGHTSRLLKALLGTSILFLLAHFVFQICLYTLPILDQLLGPSCEYGVRGQPAMGVPTPALALLHLCPPRLHPLPAVPQGWTPKMVTCGCGDPILLGAGGLLRLCGVPAMCPAPGACCAVPGCPLGGCRTGHRPRPGPPWTWGVLPMGKLPALGGLGTCPRGVCQTQRLRASPQAAPGRSLPGTSGSPGKSIPAVWGWGLAVARRAPLSPPLPHSPPQAGLERHPQLGASCGARCRHPAGLVPLPVPVPPPCPQGRHCRPRPETGVPGAP